MPKPIEDSLRFNREHHYFEFTQTYKAWLRWALLIVALLLGGIPGVLAVVIAQGLLFLGGDESAAKHGISTNLASRLGGVIIFSFLMMSLLLQTVIFDHLKLGKDLSALLLGASAFFLIGIFEDMRGILSAGVRFVAMLVVMSVFLYFEPQFILQHSGVDWLDQWVLIYSAVGFLFTLFGVVFYVNAFNTADGANGLISGICIFTVLALMQEGLDVTGAVLALLGIGCFIFWLFNITIGRIFMGDGGAYFLGAIISLTLIWLVNQGQSDVWYLLSLTFYPHADLLFSMIRRKLSGNSMFGADNGHFHNLLYGYLSRSSSIKKEANTLTGLAVSTFFSGLPFMLHQFIDDLNWVVVYVALWGIYAFYWRILNRLQNNRH